ncbi:MAG: hypothetical protein AAFU79_04280 [Myxococcota bacterium]
MRNGRSPRQVRRTLERASRASSSVLLVLSSLGFAAACTDVSLYGRVGQDPTIPDKLTLTGLLCTDNPGTRAFPVKILYLVDTSGTTLEAAPLGDHVRAFRGVLSQFLPNRFVEVGIIRYADRPESLVSEVVGTMTKGFTRDEAQLDAALAQIRNGGGGRDLAAAMSLARSVVTGDAFQADRGPLSRTKYVLVHLTSGSPSPRIPNARCDDLFEVAPDDCERAFLERSVRNLRDEVLALGAAELVFHVAHLEPTPLEGAPCDPRSGSMDCAGLAPGTTCVRSGSRVDVGRCVELCDPAAAACVTDPARLTCAEVPVADGTTVPHCSRAAELSCFDGVDNDGDGQDVDCSDPNYPLDCDGSGGCEEDCLATCRAAAIGVDMALAGGGRYERFATADTLTYARIDFRSTQRRFVLKGFVIDNRNAVATEGGLVVDSDGDGLPDEDEARLGLDPRSRDSDGDGLSDPLEQKLTILGLDPFVPGVPPDCVDAFADQDGDGLGDCEEQLLATDPSLIDSDADGFPDELEVRRGTNPLVDDGLEDLDQDGIPNGRELVEHTDARSNDAAVRNGLAYRMRVTPAGVTENNRTCYDLRVSNITLLETLDRGLGPGFNDVDVFFGQVPEGDLGRFGSFTAAQVRVQFVLPDFREPATPALDLVDGDFVFLGE